MLTSLFVAGPMNVMIPFTAATAIITYAWPFARTEASLIVVTILYGCVSLHLSIAPLPFLHSSHFTLLHAFIIHCNSHTPSFTFRFASGSYVSLLSNPVMEFGDTGDVGRRVGMMMSILAIGAVGGPPISGAINTATGGFEAVGYYAGSVVIVGVGLMCWTKYLVLGRLSGKL